MYNQLLESNVTGYIAIGVIIVLLIAFFVWSFLSQKKKQKAYNETINAIRPGSKVKTIGGIVGEVVEVNDEEGTFVLRTGDSTGNVSFMKFDKQAIYQTDAKPEQAPAAPAADKAEEKAPEEPFAAEQNEAAEEPAAPAEEGKAEEKAEAPAAEEKAEEAPAEAAAEEPAEEKPAAKPAAKKAAPKSKK